MKTYIGAEHQSKGSSVVYWIHTPRHKDMFCEGYIGISKQKVQDRWRQHFEERKESMISFVHKNGTPLIFEVILVADSREYCEQIEKKLRPTPNIGWNVAQGGKDGYVFAGGEWMKKKWVQHWIDNPIEAANRWWKTEQLLIAQTARLKRNANKPKPHTKLRGPNSNSTSGIVGVRWFPKYKKWNAQIAIRPKVINLGYYQSIEEANQVSNQAIAIRSMWRLGNIQTDTAIANIKALRCKSLALES
jgi:hypothetical protein